MLAVKRLVKERSPRLFKALDRINKLLLELKRECEGWRLLPDAAHLAAALSGLFSEMEKFMEDHREFEGRDTVLDFYFAVRSFLTIYERVDERYRIYTELQESGEFRIRLFCVNPIRNIGECLEQGVSTVFFSATLLPIRYYRELLSNDEEDYTVYVNSPFSQERRILLTASDVTSRYTRRNEKEYRKILEYIYQLTEARKGNYIVFFPSYQYMMQVYGLAEADLKEKRDLNLTILLQNNRMTEREREEFLAEFEMEREESLAAFCVMGGLFSEGIDLKEERLIGAVIVGTGLPMVCTEQEILRGYFEEKEKDGFAFAYQYPGMNKVMQAAGRVIRTAGDKGVILLLDDRFLRRDYQELFPREWNDAKMVTLRTLRPQLENFWSRFPEAP